MKQAIEIIFINNRMIDWASFLTTALALIACPAFAGSFSELIKNKL